MKFTSKKRNALRDRETVHCEGASLNMIQLLNSKGEGLDLIVEIVTEDRVYTLHMSAEEYAAKAWTIKQVDKL